MAMLVAGLFLGPAAPDAAAYPYYGPDVDIASPFDGQVFQSNEVIPFAARCSLMCTLSAPTVYDAAGVGVPDIFTSSNSTNVVHSAGYYSADLNPGVLAPGSYTVVVSGVYMYGTKVSATFTVEDSSCGNSAFGRSHNPGNRARSNPNCSDAAKSRPAGQ